MNRLSRTLLLPTLALLVAACGSVGLPGGTGDSYPPPASRSTVIEGTVDMVDTRARTISLRDVRSDATRSGYLTVAYDDRTPVEYRGASYRPGDLERGDRVRIESTESSGRLMAERIAVVSNVRSNDGPVAGSRTVSGTVRHVDSRDRTIEVQPWSGTSTRVGYDSDTLVTWQGRRYSPTSLQQGDEVTISLREFGGRLVAEEIKVTRSMSDGGTSQRADVTGSVSSVDTYARRIVLDRPSWGPRFQTGGSDRVTLDYDGSTVVEYQGQRYQVTNLETGDVVDVYLRAGSQRLIDRIIVVRNVRDIR